MGGNYLSFDPYIQCGGRDVQPIKLDIELAKGDVKLTLICYEDKLGQCETMFCVQFSAFKHQFFSVLHFNLKKKI